VAKPSGIEVVRVEGLSKAYGEKKLFDEVTFALERGTRLGIIGANGTGKTTLLTTLSGEVPADAGKSKWGHGVNVQFYRQEQQDLLAENTILEELQRAKITANQQQLRDLAGMFMFSGDIVEKKVGVLSGGEKARVALARMLLNPANTILMDEPTNHLDMPTCEVLEEALDSYDGTLILVSHDRYFLDQVCDQLLVLQGNGQWRMYMGSYTDYLAAVTKEQTRALEAKREADRQEKQRAAECQRRAAEQARKQSSKHKAKLPYKYQKMTIQAVEYEIP